MHPYEYPYFQLRPKFILLQQLLLSFHSNVLVFLPSKILCMDSNQGEKHQSNGLSFGYHITNRLLPAYAYFALPLTEESSKMQLLAILLLTEYSAQTTIKIEANRNGI